MSDKSFMDELACAVGDHVWGHEEVYQAEHAWTVTRVCRRCGAPRLEGMHTWNAGNHEQRIRDVEQQGSRQEDR